MTEIPTTTLAPEAWPAPAWTGAPRARGGHLGRLGKLGRAAAPRALEVAFATAVLLALAPLLLFLAVLVSLDSPGGPFYRSWRVGRNGRLFRMWKFRTMVRDADRLGPQVTARRDPRVTRLGRFLRRSKLDELPQFLNLLTGDLALIGPRPQSAAIVRHYSPEQRRVLRSKPGITGPGQLYYTRHLAARLPEHPVCEEEFVRELLGPKLQEDLRYPVARSPWTDAKVLLATLGIVIRGMGGGDPR